MSGTRSTDLPIIDDYASSYCALFELGFLNVSGKSDTKEFSYANYVCFKTIWIIEIPSYKPKINVNMLIIQLNLFEGGSLSSR